MTTYTDGMHPPLIQECNDLTREEALDVLCRIIDNLAENHTDEWKELCKQYSGNIICYHDILKPFGISQVEISHVFEPDDDLFQYVKVFDKDE